MEKYIISRLQKNIGEIIKTIQILEPCRETDIAIVKLREASRLLGADYERVNILYEYKTVVNEEAEEWAKNYRQLEKEGWQWIEDNTRQGKYKRFCIFKRARM